MSRLCRAARSRSLLLLLLLCLMPASAQQTSSGNGSQVALLLTVIDKQSKKFVTTLGKEDVRVVEDGAPQIITDFKQQTDKPLSLIIMLDMSVSQEKIIPVAKQVSREFIDAIISQGRDRVGVVSFMREAKFEQELTLDLKAAHQAIERLEFIPPTGYVSGGMVTSKPSTDNTDQQFAGSTAIWDTINTVSENIGSQPADNRRRLIVLFTDGQDTSSKLTLERAAKMALKSGVVVYSIGLGDNYYGGINKDVLRKISERTSGRAFFPKKMTDVQGAFAEIEEELRSQYLISYSPSNRKVDDRMRKIKIEIVNPELRKRGLQLSYQQGYFTRG